MARRPNSRAIKRHRNYTMEEAAIALGVAKGTVRRWLDMGLEALRDQRPWLILGRDLSLFLDRRKATKQKCQPHEFFCFRCRAPKPAAGGMVDFLSRNIASGQLSAICETCGTIMHKNYSTARLPVLMQCCEVSFPQGAPHIGDRAKPR